MILAPFNKAIVRIEATIKIFSLRNKEYSPTLNNVVVIILVINREGSKK